MKRPFKTLIALLFLIATLPGCAVASTQVPTPDANSLLTRIRMGVVTDLPPYATYDAIKQEPAGFDIELMKTIAKKTGIYVEFLTMNAGYNHLLSQVEQCQLDGGISAIALTDENPTRMIFSEPYFSTGQVLVVKEGNIKITGLEALSGMTVGTQANSLSALELGKIQGVQPKLFESFHIAFQELIAGNIDAVIADHPRAWKYTKVKPNNLRIVGPEFASVSYAIAFCKDQTEVQANVNTALAGLKKDGTLDKLTKTWQLGNYGQ